MTQLFIPTLSCCYLTEEFPKWYWKCIGVMSGNLLLQAPRATLPEVRKSLLLIAYSWFYSSQEFNGTGYYPCFSTFFLICNKFSLKMKVINQMTYTSNQDLDLSDVWFWGEKGQQSNRTKCFFSNINYNTPFKHYWPLQILQACSLCLKNNFLCCKHTTDTVPSTESTCISYQWQDSSFMLNLESFY